MRIIFIGVVGMICGVFMIRRISIVFGGMVVIRGLIIGDMVVIRGLIIVIVVIVSVIVIVRVIRAAVIGVVGEKGMTGFLFVNLIKFVFKVSDFALQFQILVRLGSTRVRAISGIRRRFGEAKIIR
jgi:hypothetical protein